MITGMGQAWTGAAVPMDVDPRVWGMGSGTCLMATQRERSSR